MAKVYLKDIKQLFKKSVEKFEAESGIKLVDSKKELFFKDYTPHVNKVSNANLRDDTVYKQYYIRLKRVKSETIGCSRDYLDAFCLFVHSKPYNEVYQFPEEKPKRVETIIDDKKLALLKENPEILEYPEQYPSFPATPSYPVEIPGFNNVWIKDESFNPNTGTHKDRMAWEVYLFYREELRETLNKKGVLMPLSIISSGNAALAIQHIFKSKNMPNLKVILDNNLSDELKEAIKNSGCDSYYIDLDSRELSAEDILQVTKNEGGIQLNFTEGIEDLKLVYYDWLSFEILNLNPDYVFVPFGSGELYKNILSISTQEIVAKKASKRYFVDKNKMHNCHFLGATAYKKNSSLKMLYAKYNNAKAQDMEQFVTDNICGEQSQVKEVQETYVKKAIKLAKKLGIRHEPSGVAGLALLLQIQGEIDTSKKIVVVNTGKLKIEQFS